MKKRAGRRKLNKIRVNITLDKNLYEELTAFKVQISTLINNLIYDHLSLYSSHYSQVANTLITRRSVVQIHSSLLNKIGINGKSLILINNEPFTTFFF
ncbi:MAG: hypothetical protein KC589_00145 [Nanoarchaeota archaeon]|nr:hypothetical protein [Nanoarchaeota archaeon]